MRRFIKIPFIIFTIILSLAFISCSQEIENDSSIPAIDILNIGKADCIVINTGKNIVMIDTGEANNIAAIHDFMSRRNYESIHTLILTHYDKDHIGGADSIISAYKVQNVIESRAKSSSTEYKHYHEKMSELSITPKKLEDVYTFTLDGFSFTVDVPRRTKYSEGQDNNLSLIVSMEYGENSFLFCADAMEERISEWIHYSSRQYDFVKLPYHGNYLTNYDEFISKSDPQYAAITCSNKNPPSDETLAMLIEKDIAVYQTRHGEIHVEFDENSITVIQ